MTAPGGIDRVLQASRVRPTAAQVSWQQLEFYGFIHFGMNTMTDREWGLGHEDPALFEPEDLDAGQWVRSMAAAGMTAIILTCKHHDGFALWPSAVSAHTVAASPWRDGHGDLVGEVAQACVEAGLRFGVYLSPWDRTESSYGSGAAYDDFFVAQLTELLTGYGPIFCVWLDGANGEGPAGRRQLYDFDRYFRLIRELQPDAVISVCGPDVRWCGNEAGSTRPQEWSVVPAGLRNTELTASRSQQADDGAFAARIPSDQQDLGSREALRAADQEPVWYPAEVNTSIRPGWFHHPAEDGQVRSADELFTIYRRSVGGNAGFLLNVPPDRSGRVSVPDVVVLVELGRLITGLATRDVAARARWSFSGSAGPDPATRGADGRWSEPWRPDADQAEPSIRLELDAPVMVTGIGIGEDIRHGQQIDGLDIEVTTADGRSVRVDGVQAVGHLRIVDVSPIEVSAVTLTVRSSRGPVAVARVHLYADAAGDNRRPGADREGDLDGHTS